MSKEPKVGIGVIISREGKILLGKRISKHGHGQWAIPGGKLEYGESWEACAQREVAEETGLEVTNIENLKVINHIFDDGQHWIIIFMKADYVTGEAKNMEPDKCEGWEWFAWDNLPDNLFFQYKEVIEPLFLS